MADQLTFEELLNKKRQAGFDEFMAKDKLNKRIEERNSFKEKSQREKSERK
jgi:ribosomal RNA-processing protein 36